MNIVLFLLVLALWSTPAEAQYTPKFDLGIQQLALNAAPNYHFDKDWKTYDFYTQYVPGLLLVGLKACGYEGRSDWGRMLVSDAFSGTLAAGLTLGLKYSVGRLRPDGSSRTSFPSGHSATAFALATALSREYHWRSPWWSFGGYTLATVTTMGRLLNNRHWMSDTFAGALIGVGSVELGYFLADLIFKDNHLCPGYIEPEFSFGNAENGYYSLQYGYTHRFVVGAGKENIANSVMPQYGSNALLMAEIPVVGGTGVAIRAQAGSLVYKDGTSFNLYGGQVGLYWEMGFAKVLEVELQALIGGEGHRLGGGIDLSAGASLNIIPRNNFKLRAMAEWETFSFATRQDATGKTLLHSILLGGAAAFYW